MSERLDAIKAALAERKTVADPAALLRKMQAIATFRKSKQQDN